MSSADPCKCVYQDPGYGGICNACGKECFRQEEEPEEERNPYTCHVCGNIALYRIDHKPDCIHYPPRIEFIGRES